MGAKTLMTAEEFDRLEESDEFRYELDEGELIVMTKPRPLHNRIALKLTSFLLRYIEENPVGEVMNSDNMYVLGPNTRRAPDVSFLRKERAAAIDPAKDIEGAPDLAIEVLSPTGFPGLYLNSGASAPSSADTPSTGCRSCVQTKVGVPSKKRVKSMSSIFTVQLIKHR